MSTPFSYVDNEKIDLSNQKHRDEIIKRNKNLEKICSQKHYLEDMTVHVNAQFNIDCPKCGSKIPAETDIEVQFGTETDIADHFGDLRCRNCEFGYFKLLNLHQNEWIASCKPKTNDN